MQVVTLESGEERAPGRVEGRPVEGIEVSTDLDDPSVADPQVVPLAVDLAPSSPAALDAWRRGPC